MKKFLDEDFLLNNKVGLELYQNYAKNEPIFDYHNHLNAKEIYEDKKFDTITDLWLIDDEKHGDHYKWRLMRANGVDEFFITGNASKKEKFIKWMETLSISIGNPLHHWSNLELKKYFGIDEPIKPIDACKYYDILNEKLSSLTVRKILEMSNVKVLATTNDPSESLEYHHKLKEENYSIKVVPTFRPDKATNVYADGYLDYLKTLSTASNIEITSYSTLLKALENRLLFFKENGSFICDHSVEDMVYTKLDKSEKEQLFSHIVESKEISKNDMLNLKMNIIGDLARLYHKYGFALQLHLKAIRNNSRRNYLRLGPDSGFDAINDQNIIKPLSRFFSDLDESEELPKIILYSLDNNDLPLLAALGYCFQDGIIPGKIQIGPSWWFNDTKVGMEKQLEVISNFGLFYKFIGMVTDSRSFLSFARHDYFRRVLCNYVGSLVECGEIPFDMDMLEKLIKGICFNNALNYFK